MVSFFEISMWHIGKGVLYLCNSLIDQWWIQTSDFGGGVGGFLDVEQGFQTEMFVKIPYF